MSNTTLEWTLLPFDRLDGRTLEAWLRLRQQVFVVEQRCPYADIDGRDPDALHLLGFSAGRLLAGARLFAPQVEAGPHCRIGRVVVAPEWRGGQLGRGLMRQALEQCARLWPAQPVRISAQAHLQPFYASLGFVTLSAPYDEDGIPHVDMESRPALTRSAASDPGGQ